MEDQYSIIHGIWRVKMRTNIIMNILIKGSWKRGLAQRCKSELKYEAISNKDWSKDTQAIQNIETLDDK